MPSESDEQGTVRYIRCASCGSPNPATSTACARCGKPLQAPTTPAYRPAATQPMQQIMCPKCRKPFPVGSKFCGYCGTPLPAAPVAAPKVPPRPAASAQPAASHVPSKVTPPAAKPVPPRPFPAPSTPVVAKPVSPARAHVPVRPTASQAVVPAVPKLTQPKRVGDTPQASPEGTVVFTGLRTSRIEATISEKKADGSPGKSLTITEETSIGRADCDLTYPDDALLSPRHASLAVREGKLYLKDLNSQNGIFIRQRQDSELLPGDIFLLGRELFRFTTQSLEDSQNPNAAQGTMAWQGPPKLQRGPVTAKLEHIKLTGEVIDEFRLEKPETTLGRTTGDLVFKDDPYMSGTHARVVAQPGRFILQDLRSRNGVYRRLRNEGELRDGDEFFLGEQIFQVEVKTLE